MPTADIQTHYRACNLCEAMCGVEIKHQDGKVLSIKGDKKDPFSHGHICPKAVALKDLYEDPDRIRQPMKRMGNSWKPISWKQALDEAAAGIQKVQAEAGKDAVGLYLGNPNVHNTGTMLMIKNLIKALGSSNMYAATSIDQLPHHITAHHLFGHQLRIPVPDIDRTDYMLVFGGNPLASNGSIMTAPDVKKRLKGIQKRNGKIVVIDPRRSETADVACEHQFIKPGSDALMLLAMLNVMFADNLVQSGKLQEHILHVDHELKTIAANVARYTPEVVADKTGIAADEIRRITHEFCSAEKPVCYGRMGVSVQSFGLLCQYLILLINILRGQLDSEGGMMWTTPAADIADHTGPGGFGAKRSRVRNLPAFNREFPVSTLVDEISTPGFGQIKAMVTCAGNPVLSTPNGAALDQAMAGLDFMVAIDYYLNETNRHANIILPPVSPLEREHYDVIFHVFAVQNTVRYAEALFEKPKDAMHDWEIFLELEQRLNPPRSNTEAMQRKALRKAGPKGLLRLLLHTGPYGGFKAGRIGLNKLRKNPHGIDLGGLKPGLPKVLKTKDKKIHLHTGFYFADLVRLNKELLTAPDTAAQPQQAMLIGRRHIRSNNSWLHNSQRLVKGKLRCTALMHPSQAEQNGFKDGDDIVVRSRTGEITVPLEVSDEIMPGVISVPHGWGHKYKGTHWATAEKHAGVSVNDLTDGLKIDELSGNAAVNGVPVEVRAA